MKEEEKRPVESKPAARVQPANGLDLGLVSDLELEMNLRSGQ